jgi:hypothetical protein
MLREDSAWRCFARTGAADPRAHPVAVVDPEVLAHRNLVQLGFHRAYVRTACGFAG